jgi:NADPH-dependent 7-cyano-7-deazaguanine reductase QueF
MFTIETVKILDNFVKYCNSNSITVMGTYAIEMVISTNIFVF